MQTDAALSCEGNVIVPHLARARRVDQRMVGLLGQATLPDGHGLLIDPCPSVHTWFMRFSLDLVFFDRQWRVVTGHRNVRPFRGVLGGRGAVRVLECRTGWLPEVAFTIGRPWVLTACDTGALP